MIAQISPYMVIAVRFDSGVGVVRGGEFMAFEVLRLTSVLLMLLPLSFCLLETV